MSLKREIMSLLKTMEVLIDLIFVGYMLAESKIEPKSQYEGEEFMEDIKSNWSKELSKILKNGRVKICFGAKLPDSYSLGEYRRRVN